MNNGMDCGGCTSSSDEDEDFRFGALLRICDRSVILAQWGGKGWLSIDSQ